MQINGQTQAVEAALTIDETKFLGGDVEHTHLVKGLDYALLAKVNVHVPHCNRYSALGSYKLAISYTWQWEETVAFHMKREHSQVAWAPQIAWRSLHNLHGCPLRSLTWGSRSSVVHACFAVLPSYPQVVIT